MNGEHRTARDQKFEYTVRQDYVYKSCTELCGAPRDEGAVNEYHRERDSDASTHHKDLPGKHVVLSASASKATASAQATENTVEHSKQHIQRLRGRHAGGFSYRL